MVTYCGYGILPIIFKFRNSNQYEYEKNKEKPVVRPDGRTSSGVIPSDGNSHVRLYQNARIRIILV